MRHVARALVASMVVLACAHTTTNPVEPTAPAPHAKDGSSDASSEPTASQPPSVASTERPSPEAVSVLVGAWVSEDARTLERWTTAGEHLVGVGFTSAKDGKTTASFEVMLIHHPDGHPDGRPVFTAIPGGEAIVDFEVALEPDRLRLTNPEHDDPTEIVYHREGEHLAITLGGAAGPRHFALRGREPTPAPALEELDVAFAADSAARGGVAWVERFDPEGFAWSRGSSRRDGEASGAMIDTMRAGGHDLQWRPIASGLAPAGDLGFTTGRYRVVALDGSGKVVSTGTFVTIWRKREDGWHIAFDSGVPDSAVSVHDGADEADGT